MSKEDYLKRLELEYSLFEVDSVTSLEEVRGYILVLLDDFLEHAKTFKKEIKNNYRFKIETILSNYFSCFVGYDYPDFYDEDTKIIKEEVTSCINFKKLIERLLSVLGEDNFQDVYKLCDFCRKMYFEYYYHYEQLRSVNEMNFRGIYGSVPDIVRFDDFVSFFNSEIMKIRSNIVEKKKVM